MVGTFEACAPVVVRGRCPNSLRGFAEDLPDRNLLRSREWQETSRVMIVVLNATAW